MKTTILLLVTACVIAAELPVQIRARDPLVLYAGRWTDDEAPRARWSGASLRFRFNGQAAQVLLDGDGDNRWQVSVDGVATQVLTLSRGSGVYAVAEGLAMGRHEVELFKATEGFTGATTCRGIRLPAGGSLVKAKPRVRSIEFIGDSITAGYGIESNDRNEHFSPATENAWYTGGAIAARRLDADYYGVAWSGGRLSQGEGVQVPPLWSKTEPDGADWDFARHQVDAVVVNLGTNDERFDKPWDGVKYREALRGFIAGIRARYPKAHIFATIGPMTLGPNADIQHACNEIAAERRKAGDGKVHAIDLFLQDESTGFAADWHPSRKGNERMADMLVTAVSQALGWNAGPVGAPAPVRPPVRSGR